MQQLRTASTVSSSLHISWTTAMHTA